MQDVGFEKAIYSIISSKEQQKIAPKSKFDFVNVPTLIANILMKE